MVADRAHPLSFEPSNVGRLYTQMGVAETLIDADHQGAVRPGLATAWTRSDDGLEWRFTLRPAARFHDGSAVTPAAVVSALERARKRAGVFDFLSVEGIAEEGEKVLIKLRSPSTLVLPVLANFANQILAPASFDAEGGAIGVVGSGPYKVRSTTEQEVTVDFWEGWSGPRPQVLRARYISAGRAETRAALAESGQADIVIGLDTAGETRLTNRPDVKVVKVPSPRTIYLKVNSGHPFLNDPRARRALSLAIDRQGIASGLLQDPQRVADQLMPPSITSWRQVPIEPLRTDPVEARKLLAELGWRPGPDGILERGGRRFSLNMLCPTAEPEVPLIGSALQQQLRSIGVEIKVQITSMAQTPAGHNDGTLQLALVDRGFLLIPDVLGTLIRDYTNGGGETGAMGWRNPVVDEALDALAAGVDDARVGPMRAQVLRILQDELPIIPVCFNPRNGAISKRIENATVDPLERSYGLDQIRWRS